MNENIILNYGAGAFLKRDGHYLLMKRSTDKKIAPGVWSNVGGHAEIYDLIYNQFLSFLTLYKIVQGFLIPRMHC